mmetsp:Transcript_29861/g.69013  ORF Transcript_29861/g.69013 Transcript_29861/m.69013 type:complete len:206 (-) Transcript_29861:519-1136(-)
MRNGHLDGVRGAQAVEAQRGASGVVLVLLPHVPLGVEVVGRVVLHPAGEALVEPEVVPPRHRHQVAEPLVSKLVRDDSAHALALRRRGVDGVNQNVHLPVGDKPPIFHCSHGKLRDCHHVQFRERVRLPEHVIVQIQRLASSLEGEVALGRFPRRSVHAHKDSVLRELLHKIELSNTECEEVGGHLRAVHKLDDPGLATRRGGTP